MMERLEGHLEMDAGLVADFELRAGSSKHNRSQRTPCRLRLANGSVVEVDPSNAAIDGWRAQELARGTWAEIQSHAAASLFHEVAPGPHVSASLQGLGPRHGDRVVLEGEITRVAPAGNAASYRDQPPEPVAVRIVVARVINPEAKPTERRRDRRKVRPAARKSERDD